LKFYPENESLNGIPQLEEFALQMERDGNMNIDAVLLLILEHQSRLKKLGYAFPFYGVSNNAELELANDARMLYILNRNHASLESVSITGFKEGSTGIKDEVTGCYSRERPWDAIWFQECRELTELIFRCNDKNSPGPGLFQPHFLPTSLRCLKVVGTVNTGNMTLEDGLESLENLQELELSVSKHHWFSVQGQGLADLDVPFFLKLLQCLPNLRRLKLLKYLRDYPRVSSCVSRSFMDWLNSSVYFEAVELTVPNYIGIQINVLPGYSR
jgi:hypothetical protein